jgi:hypothetical protein
MKKICMAVLLALIAVSSVDADLLDLDNAPEYEKYVPTFRYEGIDFNDPPKNPFGVRYDIAEAPLEAVVENKFVGQGADRHIESTVTAKTYNGCTSKLSFKFKPGDRLSLDVYERRTFLPDGKQITYTSYNISELIPTVPDNTVQPFTMPLAIRGIDYIPGNKYKIYLWFDIKTVFAMDLIVKGEEEVTVPAGTFDCHRLEVAPDVVDLVGPVIGFFASRFVPKVTIWVDKENPHRLVKYRGPFGMLNIDSSQVEIFELKEIIK